MTLRNALAACLVLLCLSSQAQTVSESMALFDEGKTSEAVAQPNKLGQRGNADAQNLLGLLYDNGQGDPHVQRQLGTLYAKGLGVAQNKMLAYMWLDIARGLGEQSALRTLTELSETMSRDLVARAQELAKQCIAKSYQGCEAT